MIELLFKKERDTKNTRRYQEVDAVVLNDPVEPDLGKIVGTLYVQKWALRTLAKHLLNDEHGYASDSDMPETIKVTIEVTDLDPGADHGPSNAGPSS